MGCSRVSDNIDVSNRDADEVIFSTAGAPRQQPVPIGSFIDIPWSAPAKARPALSLSLWAFLVNSHQVMQQKAQSLLSLGEPGEVVDQCLSLAIETAHMHGGIIMSLIFASEGNAPVLAEVNLATKLGEWVHIAVVAGEMGQTVYLDGIPVGQAEAIEQPLLSSERCSQPQSLVLGARIDADGHATYLLDGAIARVAIVDGALSSSSISELADAKADGSAVFANLGESLIGAWPMRRGADPSSVSDSGRYAMHGEIINGGLWYPGLALGNRSADAEEGVLLFSDDLVDCSWDAVHSFALPRNASAGFYVARLRYNRAPNHTEELRPPFAFCYDATFIVRGAGAGHDGLAAADVLVLAATNTWLAYSVPFVPPVCVCKCCVLFAACCALQFYVVCRMLSYNGDCARVLGLICAAGAPSAETLGSMMCPEPCWLLLSHRRFRHSSYVAFAFSLLCATQIADDAEVTPLFPLYPDQSQWPFLNSPYPPSSSLYEGTRHHLSRPNVPVRSTGLRRPWPAAAPYAKWEHRAFGHKAAVERPLHSLLRKLRVRFDLAADFDLHREGLGLLARYQVLIINGHSEYWSTEMVEVVGTWLGRGGRLISLSGDTMYWRVSFGDGMRAMESRKTAGFGEYSDRMEWHSTDGRMGGPLKSFGMGSSSIVGLEFWAMQRNFDAVAHYVAEATSHPFFHAPCRLATAAGATFKPHFNGLEFDASVPTIERHSPYTQNRIVPAAVAAVAGLTILATELFPSTVTVRYEDMAMNVWLVGPHHHAPPTALVGAEIIHWKRPAGGQVFAIGSILAGAHLYDDVRLAALFFNALVSFCEPRPPAHADCPAFLQASL